jgi:hypothetical protein
MKLFSTIGTVIIVGISSSSILSSTFIIGREIIQINNAKTISKECPTISSDDFEYFNTTHTEKY